jgi:ATP-dependent protease ClpP protease subunit
MSKKAYIVNRMSSGLSEILIYDMLYNDCENSLNFTLDIAALALKSSEIKIRINSDGGSVNEGKGMIAAVENIKRSGKKVKMHIDGIAASMSAILAMTGSWVVMKSYARLMFHEPSGSVNGNSEDLRTVADEMDAITNEFADIIAKRAGITKEQAREKYLKKGVDTYLTAQEALDAKLIDEIESDVTMLCPTTINNSSEYHKFFAKRYSVAAVTQSQNNNKTMKKELLVKLGLPLDATQDQIDAAVEASLNQNKTLTDSIAAMNDKEINDCLDMAITETKITADKKDTWKAAFKNNVEGLKIAIGALPKAVKPTEMIAQQTQSVHAGAADAGAGQSQAGAVTGAKKFDAMYAQGVEAVEKWRKEQYADYSACYKDKYGRTPAQMSVKAE